MMLAMSPSSMWPVRMLPADTRDSLDSIRPASCWVGISSENTATALRRAVGRVRGQVQGERGLSHRGARADDDQVTGLKAGRHQVQIGEPRGQARDGLLGLVGLFDLVQSGLQGGVQGHETLGRLLLTDLIDDLLRLVDQAAGVVVVTDVGLLHDADAGGDQAPDLGLVVDDLGVVLEVDGGERRLAEADDVVEPAAVLELALLLEARGHGDRVERQPGLGEGEHPLIDEPMSRRREVLGAQDAGHPVEGGVVEEHAAEHGLLGGLGLEVSRGAGHGGETAPRGGVRPWP